MIRMRSMATPAITSGDVRDFYAAVLAQDAQTLQRIEDSTEELELQAQGFVFSLPALHRLLDPQQSLEFRDFRKLLYASTLNQQLGAFDAEVTLLHTTGKVDTSRYCLRRSPGQ